MHTETLPLEDNGNKLKVHNQHTIFQLISSNEPSMPTILIAPKTDVYLEKRIWELVPDNGVEMTFQILLNEGKHVSFNEVSHIATKKFGENVLIKSKAIYSS